MRFADCIVELLEHFGVRRCFMVTGGAAMHLNDAFRVSKSIEVICLHNEQSCAMAAEAYFKISGQIAVVCVTAGPGALNTLNGVWGAYADSAGMIVVAGQCRTDHIAEELPADNRPRLFGDQDCPTRAIISPMVSGFHRVMQSSGSELHACARLMASASSGRPSPVWIELPINIQGAPMLPAPSVSDFVQTVPINNDDSINAMAIDLARRLVASERPVMIVGSGVRSAGVHQLVLDLGASLNIPILPVWNSIDLVPSSHPCFVGRPGADGDRSGNFVQQYSDCVIILGARMHVRQTGFDFPAFARSASEVLMVDVDENEMNKPNLKLSGQYCADLALFMPAFAPLARELGQPQVAAFEKFLSWAKAALDAHPILGEDEAKLVSHKGLNPYTTIDVVFKSCHASLPVVTSDGTAAVITQKVAYIDAGRRVITNKGCASMGYELPASIGVFEATSSPVICIAGDGSIMMNLQELAIIGGRRLPVVIFLLNNHGYHSIRQTQNNYFDGNEIGCGVDSGLYFPKFESIAWSFDIQYLKVTNTQQLAALDFASFADRSSPLMIEVQLDESVRFAPRMKTIKRSDQSLFSLPLEDMDPLLPEAAISVFAPGYRRPDIGQ